MPTESEGPYNLLPRYVYATVLQLMWLLSHPIYVCMYTYMSESKIFAHILSYIQLY
jgi:hypothetical protein